MEGNNHKDTKGTKKTKNFRILKKELRKNARCSGDKGSL
jgi:hypothetical protein